MKVWGWYSSLFSFLLLIKENESGFSLFVSKIATRLSGANSSAWTLYFLIIVLHRPFSKSGHFFATSTKWVTVLVPISKFTLLKWHFNNFFSKWKEDEDNTFNFEWKIALDTSKIDNSNQIQRQKYNPLSKRGRLYNTLFLDSKV